MQILQIFHRRYGKNDKPTHGIDKNRLDSTYWCLAARGQPPAAAGHLLFGQGVSGAGLSARGKPGAGGGPGTGAIDCVHPGHKETHIKIIVFPIDK